MFLFSYTKPIFYTSLEHRNSSVQVSVNNFILFIQLSESCLTFYKPDKQLLDIGLAILRNLEFIAEGERDLRLS